MVVLLLGCAPSTGKPASGNEKPPIEVPATSLPAGTDAPTDPSFAVVQKMCATQCAGPHARLTVFRRASGEVGVVRLDGDLESCSHPPRRYFDPAGEEILTIPEQPVEPGSEEAKKFAADQEAAVAGMKEAESLYCPDVARCEPSRTEGFRSDFACRSDEDCLDCDCRPVNRAEWNRRGGPDACQNPGEECIATNGACCDGRCALAR